MKVFSTIIEAIDPKDGFLKKWEGVHVIALTPGLARQWLDQNGFGYCKVGDIIIEEIDAETGKIVNYESHELN